MVYDSIDASPYHLSKEVMLGQMKRLSTVTIGAGNSTATTSSSSKS